MNFWARLPRPFFALAPMEDMTDTVFRELVEWISAPGKLHVVFTEFMSVDGFLHDAGHEKVRHRLYVSGQERALLNERATSNRSEWMKILEDHENAMDNQPNHRIFMPHSNSPEHEKAFHSNDRPDPLRPGIGPCPDRIPV